MPYSAKTMVDVIQRYRPDIVIEFPTRRKYLEHLITKHPDLSAIPAQEFLLQEQNNRQVYLDRIAKIRYEMKNWMKKQNTVVVHKHIITPKWPGTWNPLEYKLVELPVVKVVNDYVIVEPDQKFWLDANRLGWYHGNSFIKYEP